MDIHILLSNIPCIVCIILFFVGIINVINTTDKKVFVEYIIWICAVGCYALEELMSLVTDICNGEVNYKPSIGLVALFGCFCFLLSASLGGDDMQKKPTLNFRFSKYKAFSLLYVAMLVFAGFLTYKYTSYSFDNFYNVVVFITVLPLFFASYFTLLNIIDPNTEFKRFKYTKRCNICIMIFMLLNYTYILLVCMKAYKLANINNYLIMLSVVFVVYNCIEGKKRWNR